MGKEGQTEGLEAKGKTKAITFTRDLGDAIGDVAYTGVGFKPTHVLFTAYSLENNVFSIGAVLEALTQWLLEVEVTTAFGVGGGAAIDITDTGDAGQQGTVKSMDADGFTITWAKDGAGSGIFYVVALCFG